MSLFVSTLPRRFVAPSSRSTWTSLVQDSISRKPLKIRCTRAAFLVFTTNFRLRNL